MTRELRERRPGGLWVRISLVLAVLTSGRSLAAQSAERGPTSTPSAPSSGDRTAGSESAGDRGADPSQSQAKSTTGGYSWSDKPVKRGRRARPLPKRPNGAALATYPGFRARADGSAVVWVRLTRQVSLEERALGRVITFRLLGAYVDVRNNTHPLLTDHFPTPVKSVRLRPDQDGASLVLELREALPATHRVIEGPSGTVVLEVTIASTAASPPSERATSNPGGPAKPSSANVGTDR
jgi:hypothetical protein